MSDLQAAAGFEAPDPTQLAPLFPGYEIECLIATGGMGAVYRAVQRSLDRTVALKILPREFSADAAFCAGFEAEAKAMARLNHPNLIGVYDFGEIQGMLYIIMEFVPGQSLFHSAYGLAIDPGEVVRLVTGICSGLAHAHKHGILHRDIKPANILLDLQAEPKIGDFGLARPVERKAEEGEEIFGTPHFTAPEVVAAPHSVDHRADIFSVGVLLHELLTGKLPAEDPRPASAIAGCDARFDAVIRRATHPAVDARYASAADLAQDLNKIATTRGPRILRTAAPAAAAPGSRALPVRPRRTVPVKQPSNAPAIVTVLVMAVLGFAFYSFATRRPPAPVEDAATVPEWERAISSGGGVITPPDTPPRAAPVTPIIDVNDAATDPAPRPVPETEPLPELSAPPADSAEVPEISADDVPEFDVDGFLTRARASMRQRSAALAKTRDDALRKNIAALEGGIRTEIRRLPAADRESAEAELKHSQAEWIEKGHRVPETLDSDLADFPSVVKFHADAVVRQAAIEKAFEQGIADLSGTYVLGLEKQKEQLVTAGDTPAVRLMQQEIDLTKEDPAHFPALMTAGNSNR